MLERRSYRRFRNSLYSIVFIGRSNLINALLRRRSNRLVIKVRADSILLLF